MEENQRKEELPRKKRRVSLFRRRKRAEIRPFVKERKKREYKKIILYFLLFLLFIVALSTILYLVRIYIIEQIFIRNEQIISPQVTTNISNEQLREEIEGRGLSVSDISIATESAVATFTLNGKTKVYISAQKKINEQMELVEAIDRQITLDGKQAITIDLRYNKPIVKF